MPFQRILTLVFFSLGAVLARTGQLKVPSSFLLALSLMAHPFPVQAQLSDADISRYTAARDELKALDSDWSVISKGGGDNIRRKLGTVYSPPQCTSFTEKFIRQYGEEVNLPAFDVPSSELLQALNQADFEAYSSVFADYGNGGGGENYIQNSHTQVKRALQAIEEVIAVLKEE